MPPETAAAASPAPGPALTALVADGWPYVYAAWSLWLLVLLLLFAGTLWRLRQNRRSLDRLRRGQDPAVSADQAH